MSAYCQPGKQQAKYPYRSENPAHNLKCNDNFDYEHKYNQYINSPGPVQNYL